MCVTVCVGKQSFTSDVKHSDEADIESYVLVDFLVLLFDIIFFRKICHCCRHLLLIA